ncbi:MAG: hypothetical protein ACI3W5_04025 [Faecousia sp.]
MRENCKHCKQYYIYFVLNEAEKIAYIGISYAKDRGAILRKHLRGEVSSTKKLFGPGPNQIVPYMHVRQAQWFIEERVEQEACYWGKYLRGQGYQVLGLGSEDSRIIMTGIWEEVKRQTRGRTLEEVLRAEGTLNLHSSSRGNEQKTVRQKFTAGTANVVLNIRVRSKVAKAFRALAEQLGATQSQTLGILLDAYHGDTTLETEDLVERLEEAEAEIDDLEHDLFDSKIELQFQTKRLREKIKILQAMVHNGTACWPYRKRMESDRVPIYNKKQAKKYFPERRNYSYPKDAGTMQIKIDCLAYGKFNPGRGQAVFLYGSSMESGEKVKLRCYWRREFVGRIPMIETYRDPSLVWQIGYIVAPDKAVELIGAMPLQTEWLTQKSQHLREKQEPSIRLSELLQWSEECNEGESLEDVLVEKFLRLSEKRRKMEMKEVSYQTTGKNEDTEETLDQNDLLQGDKHDEEKGEISGFDAVLKSAKRRAESNGH